MSDQTPIAELMATDPLRLTQLDLDRIIAELRTQRHRFVLANDKKIGAPEVKKSAAQKKREAAEKLLSSDSSLSDLLDF